MINNDHVLGMTVVHGAVHEGGGGRGEGGDPPIKDVGEGTTFSGGCTTFTFIFILIPDKRVIKVVPSPLLKVVPLPPPTTFSYPPP